MNEFARKLEKYTSLLRDKKDAENAIMEEATYMATYYPRPSLKEIVPLVSLSKLKIILYVLWGALTLVVVFLILCMTGIFGMLFGVFLAVFSGAAAYYLSIFAIRATKKFKAENFEREKLRIQNEENELWNQAEYPKLKKQYEEGYSDKKIEYEKIQAEAKNKLEQTNSELKNYVGFVPEDYIGDVNSLLKIVKSGRADNLTDAINVFENDCYQEQILSEQRAARRYAESAYYEAEKTRRLQAAEIERQRAAEKQAKRDATNVCTHCINASKCRKFGTPNCPSYIPRK